MSGLEMRYFVLKPKGTDASAQASRAAMKFYALEIRPTEPELADQLVAWADRESEAAKAKE